jgi:thiol:disulfide interchange protein DsbC
MNKLLAFAFVAISSFSAYAQVAMEKVRDADLIARIETNQPSKVNAIYKTEIADLYEVHTQDRQIYFTNSEGKFFVIGGQLVDFKSRINFTAERKSNNEKIEWADLPFTASFTVKKGTGERKLAVFTDPDCPYCKRLEADLKSVDNVTISYFLLPIDKIHPQARAKAISVWCSANKGASWDALMATGDIEANSKCEHPLDAIQKFADLHKINGTPTLINASGFIIPGAPKKEKLEQFITAK